MNKISLSAIAVAAALSLTACSEQKTPEQYLASANEMVESNQLNEAVIVLKNAIVESPRDPNLRALLGKVYIEQADYLGAEKEIERALSLGGSKDMVSALAFAKLKLFKYSEAIEIAEQNNDLEDPVYLLLLVYAGVSSMHLGDLEQAQDYFNQAISINEEAVYADMAKAYLAQTTSEYSSALGIVGEILEKSPLFSEAILLKGNLLYGMGEYQQAASVFNQYTELKPRAAYVKYFLIKSLLKANDYEAAEREVDWVLSRQDSALANQYKAQIEYHKGDYRAAKEFGEKSSQAGSEFLTGKLIAGLSAYQLEDIEQAYFHLRPLEQYVGDSHPLKKIIAVINLELGYTDKAIATLSELSSGESAAFLKSASEELFNKGRMPSILTVLEKAEQLAPQNANIKAQKGLLQLELGDSTGIDSLEQALAIDDTLIDAETALALEYLKQGEDQKVTDLIDEQLKDESSKVRGLLLQGAYFSKLGDDTQAKQAFSKILALEPNNTAANFNLAVYALEEKQHKRALELYQSVLAKSPNHQRAVQGYILASVGNKSLTEASAYLETLANGSGHQKYTTLGLATTYFMMRQYEQLTDFITKQISEPEYTQMHSVLLGDGYVAQGEFEKAKQAFRSGLSKFGNNQLVMLREIGAYELLLDYRGANEKITEALSVYPDSEPLKIMQASIAYSDKRFEDALSVVNTLNGKKVSHPLLNTLNGHFAYQQGEFDKAAQYYYDSYHVSPNRLNALSLARTLNHQGKQREAAELLENYLSKDSDEVVGVLLAELYQTYDASKAIEQYRALVTQYPNNAVLLNNLAWQLYKAQRYDEAYEYIVKAREINPQNKDIEDTFQKISLKI